MWDTFDCAIVVLDAKQETNTEEQVHLLQQVKANLSQKKHVPAIVLCNKVDDPEDDETNALVDRSGRSAAYIQCSLSKGCFEGCA